MWYRFFQALFSLSDLDREIRVIVYSKNRYTGMTVISYCIQYIFFRHMPPPPLNTFNLLLTFLNLLIFVVFLFKHIKKANNCPLLIGITGVEIEKRWIFSCIQPQASEFLSINSLIVIISTLFILYRGGRYHHLHIKEFIDRNSEA